MVRIQIILHHSSTQKIEKRSQLRYKNTQHVGGQHTQNTHTTPNCSNVLVPLPLQKQPDEKYKQARFVYKGTNRPLINNLSGSGLLKKAIFPSSLAFLRRGHCLFR